MRLNFSIITALIFVSLNVSAYTRELPTAETTTPDCMANGRKLEIDNAKVLEWKKTSKEQFHGRARISGKITKIYANRTGHIHLQATIGINAGETLEVVYNEDFGRVSRLDLGSTIEACGDYITSRKANGHFPASPDGAIIHWVHHSTNPNHESGFIAIDGIVYGQN